MLVWYTVTSSFKCAEFAGYAGLFLRGYARVERMREVLFRSKDGCVSDDSASWLAPLPPPLLGKRCSKMEKRVK